MIRIKQAMLKDLNKHFPKLVKSNLGLKGEVFYTWWFWESSRDH